MHATLALLARGRRVTGVDNLDPYYDVSLKEARLAKLAGHAGFRFARIDLADATATAALFADGAFGQVVHLAAQPGVRYSLVNPGAYFANNLTAFGHVVEGCRHATGRAPRLCVELERVRRQSRVAVLGGPERRSSGEPLRGDEEGQRADRAQLQPSLPAADDGAALLHGLRAVGPSRHGADAVHQGDPRGRADPRVQRREDAPRFHLCRRHRRRRRAGAGQAARRRRRRRAVRRSTTSAITKPSRSKRSSRRSSGCSGGRAIRELCADAAGRRSRDLRRDRPARGAHRIRAAHAARRRAFARFVAWYREYYAT